MANIGIGAGSTDEMPNDDTSQLQAHSNEFAQRALTSRLRSGEQPAVRAAFASAFRRRPMREDFFDCIFPHEFVIMTGSRWWRLDPSVVATARCHLGEKKAGPQEPGLRYWPREADTITFQEGLLNFRATGGGGQIRNAMFSARSL